jgi:hypothetical protein
MEKLRAVAVMLLAACLIPVVAGAATVKPGDVITKDNASLVKDLLSPGNYVMVQRGMGMNIVPTSKLDWPPPFKSATEKYSPQVVLNPDGTLKNYVAGQPFPLLDPNDPQMATKLMWNFSFRPLYTDDADLRFPEIASYVGVSKDLEPLSYFTVGHFAFYNNIGRIEVPPVPTSPDFARSGIRYRFAFYPFLEPGELRGYGLIRERSMDPKIEDNSWVFDPGADICAANAGDPRGCDRRTAGFLGRWRWRIRWRLGRLRRGLQRKHHGSRLLFRLLG